jgi:uncharacterized protein YegL
MSPTSPTTLTEIAVILDRSGSMQSIATDAIGGFNAFLAAQRREPGAEHTRLTLVLFDDQYEVPCKSIPLAEVPDLSDKTFLPRGSTALRDAIGRTLSKMTRSFAARPAGQKPGNIIIAILTDGQENASREYTGKHIADLIEAKKELGWQFVFLAANQDAIATAAALRIDADDALNFVCNEAGTAAAFMEMSVKVSEKRRK